MREKAPGIPIEFIVTSSANPGTPNRIAMESYGVGSSETLEELNRDRTRNDELARRVDVGVQLIRTSYGQAGMTQSFRIPAFTNSWYVRGDRLTVHMLAAAWGTADLTIKNALSQKTMKATVSFVGGGLKGNPKDIVRGLVKEIFIDTAARKVMNP